MYPVSTMSSSIPVSPTAATTTQRIASALNLNNVGVALLEEGRYREAIEAMQASLSAVKFAAASCPVSSTSSNTSSTGSIPATASGSTTTRKRRFETATNDDSSNTNSVSPLPASPTTTQVVPVPICPVLEGEFAIQDLDMLSIDEDRDTTAKDKSLVRQLSYLSRQHQQQRPGRALTSPQFPIRFREESDDAEQHSHTRILYASGIILYNLGTAYHSWSLGTGKTLGRTRWTKKAIKLFRLAHSALSRLPPLVSSSSHSSNSSSNIIATDSEHDFARSVLHTTALLLKMLARATFTLLSWSTTATTTANNSSSINEYKDVVRVAQQRLSRLRYVIRCLELHGVLLTGAGQRGGDSDGSHDLVPGKFAPAA